MNQSFNAQRNYQNRQFGFGGHHHGGHHGFGYGTKAPFGFLFPFLTGALVSGALQKPNYPYYQPYPYYPPYPYIY